MRVAADTFAFSVTLLVMVYTLQGVSVVEGEQYTLCFNEIRILPLTALNKLLYIYYSYYRNIYIVGANAG